MTSLLATLGVGITVFAATDVDDLLLLAAFFADPRLRPRAIVAGQFLGIGVLVAASAVGALAALVVSPAYVALLGLIPLALGLRMLRRGRQTESTSEEAEQPSRRPHGSRDLSQALMVASVTMANGGDNLGVYIPLFAQAPSRIPLYCVVFAALTAFWCYLAHRIVGNRRLAARIERFERVLLPIVLIVLGLWIFSGIRVLFR